MHYHVYLVLQSSEVKSFFFFEECVHLFVRYVYIYLAMEDMGGHKNQYAGEQIAMMKAPSAVAATCIG